MSGTIRLLEPTLDVARARVKALSPRPGTLLNKVVGIRIEWRSFDIFMSRVAGKLQESQIAGMVYQEQRKTELDARGRGVSSPQAHTPKQIEEFARKIDVAIVGLAA